MNHGRKQCFLVGFHLTYSSNHWSNLETTQVFVEHVFIPYKKDQMEKLALLKDQKMVWLIDCLSIHKNKFFLNWMKLKFPNVCVIFIPTNCTSVFQPVDVILQCSFKHAFKKEFHSWTCSIIKSQLERGENVKVDFRMLILKPNICAWLFQAWIHVKNMNKMISKD
jgi:hypothetical protein